MGKRATFYARRASSTLTRALQEENLPHAEKAFLLLRSILGGDEPGRRRIVPSWRESCFEGSSFCVRKDLGLGERRFSSGERWQRHFHQIQILLIGPRNPRSLERSAAFLQEGLLLQVD